MDQPHAPLADARSLDPEDWEAFGALGHRMLDDMLGWIATHRDRPLHRPVPDGVRAAFAEPAPRGGEPAEATYEAFRERVLPYPHGNVHPRFWGWVVGSGTPIGMLAELLAAGMNSNSGFGDQAVVHVERQVLRWMREALGMPLDGGGILTSGCTVANLTGLAVAVREHAGWDVREEGLAGGHPRLTIYGSAQTHSSILRACELLGLGRGALRRVPVDGERRVRVAAVREAIRADRARGLRPVAIVANAGTVDAGAFDDFGALADVAREEGVWLHVDGAFGALAALAPGLAHLTEGLGRADSVAFDFHKWLHVPYDAGCVLFRDRAVQAEAFRMSGAYLSPFASTLATGPENLMEGGLQMSRGFRALKAWMTLRHYGLDRLGEAIARNVEQARYLADRLDAAPQLERTGPVPLNVVTFRFVPAGWSADDGRLDGLNRALLSELHASGVAAPSHTTIDGRFVLRVAITNHRSRREDFDLLLDWLGEHGRRLASAAAPVAG